MKGHTPHKEEGSGDFALSKNTEERMREEL